MLREILVSVPVSLALLHYPITNREGQLITTSVTNMDLHDIARSCRTFEVTNYYVVTPIEDQHELVSRILGHWGTEKSKAYHPDRVEALSRIRVVHEFEEVRCAIRAQHGEDPEVVLTDARRLPNSVSYAEYRKELEDPGRKRPVCLVFGTGWGVSEAFYPAVHRILAPVYGPEGAEGYNHLSVRAAVGIILDRLFGQ